MDVIGKTKEYWLNWCGSDTRGRIRMVADVTFWLGVLCELIVSPSGYLVGNYGEKKIILAGMVCFLISALCQLRMEIRDIILYGCIAAYGLLSFYFTHNALLLRLGLALLAGRNKNAREVIRVFFYATLAMVLAGGILSALGLHNSLYYRQLYRSVEEVRFAFGFYHPNGFSFFAVRLLLMWIYLYGGECRWRVFFPIMAIFAIAFILCNSKTGLGAFLLCALALFVVRLRKKQKPFTLLYVGGMICILAEWCLLIVIAVTNVISEETVMLGREGGFWNRLNNFSSGRFLSESNALRAASPHWLGNLPVENGTEIGFVNAWLNFGILFILLFVAVVLVLFYRAWRRQKNVEMIYILGFVFYALSEAFLPYFNKNGVWLLLIGTLVMKEGKNE